MVRIVREERGVILAFVLFITLVMIMVAGALLIRMSPEVGGTVRQRDSERALYVAETGVMRTIAQLQGNPGWRTGYQNESLQDASGNLVGTYTVQITDITDPNRKDPLGRATVEILSVGISGGITRTLRVDLATDSPSAYFVNADTPINITSGAYITGKLYAKDLNFYVMTNAPQPEIYVEEATYYQNVKYYKDNVLQANPPSEVTFGTNGIHLVPPEVFPTLDISSYASWGDPANGGLTLPAGSTLEGTLVAPASGVVYCDGDLYIQDLNIIGRLVIVVNGTIRIKNHIKYNSPESKNDGIGLFAKNDVVIDANAPGTVMNIVGQIIAQNGKFYTEAPVNKYPNGTLNFYGAITARDGVALNAYGKRNLSYDSNLRDNPLPHMTYLTQILRWREG